MEMEDEFFRDFNKDLNLSKEQDNLWKRDLPEKIPLTNDEIVSIEFKDDMISQKDFGCDALVTTKKGRTYSVDFKTILNKYYNHGTILLELVSHRYTPEEQFIGTIPGWLYKSTADLIIAGTFNKDKTGFIEFYLFSLSPFKDDYFRQKLSNEGFNFTNGTVFDNGTKQKTVCKVVKAEFISENAHIFKHWLKENENR